MIAISVEGMAEVKARFASLVPKLQQASVKKLAQAVHDDVQDGADRHTKTGALARSVFLRQLSGNSWETGHDGQKAKHALFVLWGTKPHLIKHDKRKVLRWPFGGKFLFAKFVKHPGYKGDNYLVKAAQDGPRHMARIISELQKDL